MHVVNCVLPMFVKTDMGSIQPRKQDHFHTTRAWIKAIPKNPWKEALESLRDTVARSDDKNHLMGRIRTPTILPPDPRNGIGSCEKQAFGN